MGRRGPAHPGQGLERHPVDDRHGVRGMARAREHGQVDGVVGGDEKGHVRLGTQSPLRTHLQDAADGELLERRQEHGTEQPRSVDERYWVPCFRGAVDGWHSHIFHRKCDNLGPTLTIARKDSYLFGGFADKSWKSKSSIIYLSS